MTTRSPDCLLPRFDLSTILAVGWYQDERGVGACQALLRMGLQA